VVNVTTKRPGNEIHGSLGTTVGDYSLFGVNGSVSGALVDDVLKFRLKGYHSERDGFLWNPTLGLSPDNESRSGGGGTLYWTPSEDWEISLSGNWETFDNGSSRLVPIGGEFVTVTSNVEGQMQGDSRTAALRLSYDGDDYRFDSVTAWRNWEIDPYVQDLDLGPAPAFPFGGFSRIRQEQDQWSQEFRISSPVENEGLPDWSVGVYGAVADTDHNGFNTVSGSTTFGLDENSFAVFAEGGTDLSERWRAILGLRYDRVEKDMIRTNMGHLFLLPSASNFNESWDFVSPKLTLEFEASENALLYASSSYTSKPGGFSPFANLSSPAQAQYEEEKNWANEAGIKVSGMDGRLRGRAAAFYYDIEDYQVERGLANGDYLILNADEATSYGAEFELEYDVCSSLTLDGSIGLTQTELDRYTDPLTGAVLDGNEAPYVPEYDFVLGGTWRAESGLFARLEYRGVGDTTFDDFNRANLEQGAYGVMNARVGYRRDGFTVSVFGTNLTDQNYYTNISSALFVPGGSVGAPRQVGVMATIEF